MRIQKGSGDSIFFEAAVTGDASAAIVRQEKQGQQSLVTSESLPTNINHSYGSKNTPEDYAALGITLGEPYTDDPLFCPATLPPGWRKVALSHDMWSHVVDDKGFRRIAIFYKAAFYDRSAGMSIITPEHDEAARLFDRFLNAADRTPDTVAWPEMSAEAAPHFLAMAQRYELDRQRHIAEMTAIKKEAGKVYEHTPWPNERAIRRLLTERGELPAEDAKE